LPGEPATCLSAMAALAEQGLDVLHFGRQLLSLMRDLVVLKVVGPDHELSELVDEERAAALELTEGQSSQQLERAFFGLSKLIDEVGQSAHPQLLMEMGLVRLADRPPLQPLADLMARLEQLEGGTGAPGARPAGPGATGGGSPGPGPARRGRPPGAVAGPAGRSSSAAGPGRTRSERRKSVPPPPEAPTLPEAPGPEARSPAAAAPEAPRAAPRAASADGGGDLPEGWREIIARLHETQPALGAVLEHGVPLLVEPSRVRVGFPEGSFFGKQASAKQARQVLADAAEAVLGQRPVIDVAIGDDAAGTSVAAQDAAAREARRERIKQSALDDPRVRDAIDVFPEARGNVDVQVDMD
jgi:DNA polymerase-3 subunit gamma/tau